MNGRLPQMPLDRPQRTKEQLAGLPVTPQVAETGKQQSTVARPVVGASRWSFKYFGVRENGRGRMRRAIRPRQDALAS